MRPRGSEGPGVSEILKADAPGIKIKGACATKNTPGKTRAAGSAARASAGQGPERQEADDETPTGCVGRVSRKINQIPVCTRRQVLVRDTGVLPETVFLPQAVHALGKMSLSAWLSSFGKLDH